MTDNLRRVWCVSVDGKYNDNYVYILRDMVQRNLLVPHDFICLTDHEIPGIDCIITPVTWPGWWQKLALFSLATEKLNLYLDLDVVVTGDLGRLFVNDGISLPVNWSQSGHGGCQSSVMAWAGDYSHIAQSFDPEQLRPSERGNCGGYGDKNLWGDQEYITELLGKPGSAGSSIKPMSHIYSYKYHCRTSLPVDASVVCFHGLPKPDQVNEPWVTYARGNTR